MEYLIEEIDDLPINDDPVTSEEIQLDIIITNITSSFHVGCEIDFNKIPAIYLTKSVMVPLATFKIDDCTIVIRKSGKLLAMGASSEDQAKLAAKKSIEKLRSWGFEASFNDFKVLSLFCTCLMPWRIQIEPMVTKYQDYFTCNSKLYNGCLLKMNKKQGSFNVFASGTVRIVGHTTEMIVNILEKALPMLAEFRI